MRVSLRPDPSKGVFETMLVLDGRPVELEAHLERLDESLRELYGRGLPGRTAGAVDESATAVRHGKLRLTAIPGGDGWPRTRIDIAEVDRSEVFPAPERGASLRTVEVAAGLGAHKWADRRLLEQAAAEIPAGDLPLLLDENGAVLEVSRASVFAVRRGRVVTPPLDGRILPSIARRQVLEVAGDAEVETKEAPLTLDDLLGADEVFLAGSVRGVEPVRAIDGHELPSGDVSALVATGLRRRWLESPQAGPVAAGASGRPADPPAR